MLWGPTGTAQAFAPGNAGPLAIGAVRLALGGGALLVVALIRGNLRKGDWPLCATGMAALGMAAYQPLFFAAVIKTGVAAGTMITIGSAPILAGVLGYVVRGERPDRRWAAATALAILGCVLMLGSGHQLAVNAPGFFMAVCAGASYAVYALANKQLLEYQPPAAAIAVVFCLSAVLLAPLLWRADLSWLREPRGLLVAGHLGFIATAVAYTLFSQALASLPVATAVTLSLAEPLTATLLGVLVLKERLTAQAFTGMALLFAGLVVLSRDRKST